MFVVIKKHEDHPEAWGAEDIDTAAKTIGCERYEIHHQLKRTGIFYSDDGVWIVVPKDREED